jgi:NTE family protein
MLYRVLEMDTIDAVVFEGGGVLGIAYGGALIEMENQGADFTHRIHRFAGSSAGAIAAALLACRTPVHDIANALRMFDFSSLADDSHCFISNLYRLLWSSWGYYKGDAVTAWIRKILQDTAKVDPDITLLQVHEKFGTYLHITAVNIDRQKLVRFTHETHPNLPLYLAVKMSGAASIVFPPVTYNGEKYTDGGLVCNYPIDAFDDKNALGFVTTPRSTTLGLKLLTEAEFLHTARLGGEERHIPEESKAENVIEYAQRLLSMLQTTAQKAHVSTHDWNRTIPINVGHVHPFDFTLDNDVKDRLFQCGKEAVCRWVQSKLSRVPNNQ